MDQGLQHADLFPVAGVRFGELAGPFRDRAQERDDVPYAVLHGPILGPAPGDVALAKAVEARADRHHAVLLANHGPVVSGTSLANAQYAMEELEETARLFLLLGDRKVRPLTAEQVAELETKFSR